MMLPSEGFEIVAVPEGYQPLRSAANKNSSDVRAGAETADTGYHMPAEESKPYDISALPGGESDALPFIKPEDVSYFSALLEDVDESLLSPDQIRERRIMMLLLKIKNGTPPMRKTAMKVLTEKARDFGAGPLFN